MRLNLDNVTYAFIMFLMKTKEKEKENHLCHTISCHFIDSE